MANYYFSNKAIEDLSNIWNYTFNFWSEQQADKYYGLLIDTCKLIAEKPVIGKPYEEIDLGILGFRIGKHIIFYKSENSNIVVLRILHESMDLKSRIEE